MIVETSGLLLASYPNYIDLLTEPIGIKIYSESVKHGSAPFYLFHGILNRPLRVTEAVTHWFFENNCF